VPGMYVLASLEDRTVRLQEAADLKRFHVEVVGEGDAAAVGELLVAEGVGRPVDGDDDHVWVAVEAVRRLAGDDVPDGWAEGFEAMLAYAAGQGWLDEAGSHVQAHLERPPS
jgi:hypothetical protein